MQSVCGSLFFVLAVFFFSHIRVKWRRRGWAALISGTLAFDAKLLEPRLLPSFPYLFAFFAPLHSFAGLSLLAAGRSWSAAAAFALAAALRSNGVLSVLLFPVMDGLSVSTLLKSVPFVDS
jgi:hypothetical protein